MRALPLVPVVMLLRVAPALAADDATHVDLEAGKRVNLCKSGLAQCPVSAFLCDDPKVAIVQNGPEGAELAAIAPGTTLCSVLGAGTASRRLLRVTVTEKK